MRIAVLCKWCPDPQGLEVGSDASVSLERSQWTISEYDRVALEVAMSLASPTVSVVAVVAGPLPVGSSLARKAILSRGPEALFMVVDDRLVDADAGQTSAALVAAIGQIGDVDLLLSGAGSVDLYAQQVGIQVGERLGWTTLNEVTRLEYEGARCRVDRRLDNEVETLEVPLPAALSVTADAAQPRIPGMREILSAGQRPTTVWSLDDLPPSATVERSSRILTTIARRGATRQQVLFEGEAADTARQLVQALRHEDMV